MGFLLFYFLLWPISLFKFGLRNLGYRYFRALVALFFSTCGFITYAIIPYRLLIFSFYYPLPVEIYIIMPTLYVIGFVLYREIDDSPLISFF